MSWRDVPALAALIENGDSVVAGGLPLWRKPMALVRAICATGTTGLRFSAFLASLDAELLVAAGAVTELEYGYVGRDILGSSRALAHDQAVVRHTRTELEYWGAVRARAGGLESWPDAFGRPVAPATYDVCILHAGLADAAGNIYADPLDLMEEDDRLLAASATRVLVTVERQVEEPPPGAVLMLDAGAVTAAAVAVHGAAPLGMAGAYPPALAELLGATAPGRR